MLANPPGVIPERLRPFILPKVTAPVAGRRVVAARGGTSGSNAKACRRYEKRGLPSRALAQIVGTGRNAV